MKRLRQHLEEAKNTHMEHLEDNVLNGGVNGARESINFLRTIRDALSGRSREKVNATVKWDGAPAIFVGKDPSDGKFFVAKKGVFNKTPKVYKTPAEVDADTSGDLSDKLKIALRLLKDIKVEGVIQGDFLFTNSDLKTATVDGVKYITFHPNTIVYAVPFDSRLGKQLRRSEMGVVWHTSYSGSSFESMRASYGVNVSRLGNINKAWMIDADYEDVSGNALMTANETKQVDKHLALAGRAFRKINGRTLDSVSDNEDLLGIIKTYHNTHIRAGAEITNPAKHAKGLVQYVIKKEEAKLKTYKTERGKNGFKEKFAPIKSWVVNTPLQQITAIFELQMHMVHTKKLIIDKMNKAAKLKTFLLTRKGFRITGEEGYVAIDRLSGNAVKLVDRLEFSYANFSPDIIKGWQTDSRR